MTQLRSTTVALLLTAAIVASGCGMFSRGGDDPDDLSGAGAGPAGEAAEQDFPMDDEVFTVDATFWHAGFEVAVGDATLSTVEDEFTGSPRRKLTIGVSITNLGSNPAHYNSQTVVVGSTANYQLGAELPEVPGGLTSTGHFETGVDPEFDLTDAYLLVGRDDNQQARVPLGPGGGELVDLAPREVSLSGTASMERIDFVFTNAEIRADTPDNHRQVAAGQLALTVHFDAVSRCTGSSCGFIGSDFFALILPDGSAVGQDDVVFPGGTYRGQPEGTGYPGWEVRFLVNDPPAGEYTFRFRPSGAAASWGGDGEEDATFTFTV